MNDRDGQQTQKPPETAFWLDHEYEPLINTDKLSAAANDPWQVNLQGVLSSFLRKMADYQFCNLRVGGRVLYSASYLLRRKSDVVILDSGSTQELIEQAQTIDTDQQDPDIYNCELAGGQEQKLDNLECGMEPGLEIPPELGEIALGAVMNPENPSVTGANTPQPISLAQIDFHKKGAPTLKEMQRAYFKKIPLGDLANALTQVLKKRAIKPREPRRETELPVLPENFFERAQEERANGERLQKQIEGTIFQLYEARQQPIAFVELIIHPDRKGIVRTLLSILQLSTKKSIEIWQATSETEADSEDQSGINIYLTPYGQFKNQNARK